MSEFDKKNLIIHEGKTEKFKNWMEILSVDEIFISDLLTQGVFQRSRNHSGEIILRLNMVGLLTTPTKTFFCLPKIYLKYQITSSLEILKNTLCIIHVYHNYIKRAPKSLLLGNSDIYLEGGSLLDSFLLLWQWTQEFGLHTDEEIIKDDSYNSINWHSTIQKCLPVHHSKNIFYIDTIGQKCVNRLSDLGVLQAFFLIDIQKKLGEVTEIWVKKYDPSWILLQETLQNSDIYLYDENIISNILEYYDDLCMRDNDRELIEILKNCFSEKYCRSSISLLYGISSFHVVWEHMCASAFNDVGLQGNHLYLASQPSYDLLGNIIQLNPQKPDILRILGHSIIIGDAKWYTVEQKNLPKTPDAIKQFSYRNSINSDYTIIGNFLFFPVLSDTKWVHLGQLNMTHDGYKDIRYPSIQLVGLNWDIMAQLYTKSIGFPLEFLDWLSRISISSTKEEKAFVPRKSSQDV